MPHTAGCVGACFLGGSPPPRSPANPTCVCVYAATQKVPRPQAKSVPHPHAPQHTARFAFASPCSGHDAFPCAPSAWPLVRPVFLPPALYLV
eukprot:236697-Chlamydomonas_euryale.AAC.1